MEFNAFKVVGTAAIAAGLVTGGFLTGGLTDSGKSGASPDFEPTAVVAVVNEDETGEGIVLVGDKQNENGMPVPAPIDPKPVLIGDTDPKPAPVTPVVGTPVSATPVPPTPTVVIEPPVIQYFDPEVKSISPVDGEIGVAPETKVVIKFSRSMDKADTQAAFSISHGNQGSFSWTADNTIMTFTPASDLPYGAMVNVEVSKTATSDEGFAMEQDFSSSFRVLRQIVTKIYSDAERDGHVYWSGYVSPDAQPILVSRVARGFVSFDLAQLPADLVAITGASVHVRQWDSMLGAYGPTTGNVLIQSLTYGSLSSNDFHMDAHKLCSVICIGQAPDSKLFSANPLDGWKNADMLLAVRKDWTDRENRNYLSQFRLRYEQECFDSVQVCGSVAGISFYSSNATGNANAKPYLQVAYLAP